jgi:hypothetical protein
LYRLKSEWAEAGYTLEFILGVLLSRTMAYYIFKRFSEVDPARAHAKVTHQRLATLPVPVVDFADRQQRKQFNNVTESVRTLLQGEAKVGGPEDMLIDVELRKLWGLTPDDGLHVTLELAQLPTGQVIRELFPEGAPKEILRTTEDETGAESVEVAVPV